MTSVNTNASATTALRTLQATNKALETTQNRVSTGLKIGEAKDNAAYWSISTTLKSDNKSLATVKDALGLGAATVDVAYQGLNKAKDVLDEIKAKLTSATQAGVDRKAVQADISALKDQLKSIANSSNFSGENWLAVNTASDALTRSVVASYSRDADNAVTIGKVDIDVSKVALFDKKVGSSVGILSTQATLKANGVELNIGGNAATGAAPALQGLDTAVARAGLDVGTAAAAKVNLGKFSLGGIDKTDKLSLDIAVDGGVTKTLKIDLSGVTNGTTFANAINSAITAASGFGSAVATASLNANGEIEIASAVSSSSSSISVSNLKAVDGDGTVTGFGGLGPVTAFGAGGPVQTAEFTFSNTAGGSNIALANNDKLSFRFAYNGDTYETTVRTIATADFGSATAYQAALQAMVNTATRVSDGKAIDTGAVLVNQGSAAGKILFQTAGSGPTQSLGIVDMKLNGTAVAAASTVAGFAPVPATNVTSPASTAGSTGTITFGSSMKDGDTLSFDVTLYGDNATATGSLSTKKTITVKSSATIATFQSNLQTALDGAFGANKFTVADVVTGTSFKVDTVAKGPNVGLSFGNITGTDGDGVKTSTLGLTTAAVSGTGRDLAATATKASVLSSSAFAGPVTLDAGDSIKFNVTVNSTTTAVTIDKALIDGTLGGTAGTIADADKYASVVNAALTKAGISTVVASNSGGSLKLEATTAGASTLKVTDAVASSGSSTISVDEIDITSASFNALTEAQKGDVLTAYISVVNEAITKVTSSAAALGSVAKRIDLQTSFVDTLMDTIDKGVGNLIDADLSEESTRLQALQTKQQLGVQALSIANAGTQQILSLFRN